MRNEMDFVDAEGLELIERVIKVNRSAKVMKGGRRFGFSAMVVLGDGRGVVGLGFGKAREVPPAVEKAVSDAKKRLVRVSLRGTTLPHAAVASFRSSSVKLLPAAPGTGLLAGTAARAVLEAAGVKDCFRGLVGMRTHQQVSNVRGVSLR
jgi:small subunit ribosomal protein S5